jgi:dihydroflavonol-4-reductase
VAAYQKSKTLSERAAWDFIAREGGGLELSAVNPVAVFGPVLGPDYSHSIRLIQRLLNGIPGCPKINSGFVDVRDVAKVLRRRMGAAAKKVPTRELPNWLIRIAALRDPAMRMVVPYLGVIMNATSEKAQRLLGWTPRSSEEAIVATAESLIRLGLV